VRQLFLILGVFAVSGPVPARGNDAAIRRFDGEVAPVLIQRCFECHSGGDPKGGLDLSSSVTARRGGESGLAVVPGLPQESILWARVADDEMPPENPLSDKEKEILRGWIGSGAAWGTDPIDPFRITTRNRAGYDWWALQPVGDTPVPRVQNAQWAKNGIDHFILAKLEQEGLSPSPMADRRTLIRRLSFDLLGLPPTESQVTAFVSDGARNAYERVVDRFLASPHYGIRWARHWLDVARFGESQGFERDKLREDSWPYRDWVVSALNNDMPYDEFVRLQIAGDVLHPELGSSIVATGFLVAGPYDEVGQSQQSAAMKAIVRQDELEDIVSVVSQTFLGLTVNCARCHDHKFDPIRQREYYQMTAALDGVRPGSRDVMLAGKTTEAAKPVSAYAVKSGTADIGYVLLRGNPATRGEQVAANGIRSLVGLDADFGVPVDAADADRRGKLAKWITDPANPLFARVIANRLWHYHFGVGIVETPNDFGFNGGRPSHPELVNYLARVLIQSNWSLKSLHRLIVTSSTYRQASRYVMEAGQVDADNRLLWRKSPRRLDAETLRDTILSVAAELNQQMDGPGFQDFETFTHNTQFYVMKDPIGAAFNRRSLYRTWIRSGRNRLLDVFDCPDPSTKTPQRAVTVTPLQALALMNNSFVLRMSEQFKNRLEVVAGDSISGQVRRAYQLAYHRDPAEAEISEAAAFVAAHGLAGFCRVLFNTNEFLYVD
jgi:hypothetical protein